MKLAPLFYESVFREKNRAGNVGASQLRDQKLKLERDSRNLQLKRLRKLCQDLSWKITSFTRNRALQNVPPPRPGEPLHQSP